MFAAELETLQNMFLYRRTLWRWKNEDASYIAEFNRRKQALWAASEQKLLNLIPKALEVLEGQMTSENEARRVQAAVHVLKATSFYDALHVSQITCLPVSKEEIERDKRRKKQRDEFEEMMLT